MTPNAPLPPTDAPDAVQRQFGELVELMAGRATAADAPALELLARSLVTYRTARAQVDELGPVVSAGGTVVTNPHLAVANTAQRQALDLLRQLKLTPATRATDEPKTGLPNLKER